MTQYIDKDVVVTEIEKLEERFTNQDNEFSDGYHFALKLVLSFLDTLEVKEVDLNEEFNNYTKNILACDVHFEPFTHLYNCAKHFFELGINAKGG